MGHLLLQVMLFALKNACGTYQRAMTKVFRDMIHKEMEVYVDDMVVRSETFEEHCRDLEMFMEKLTKFNVRLNPKKYVFAVSSYKLLGYVVSSKGI